MRFRRDVGGVGLHRRPALASLFFALALLFPLASQAQQALKGVALVIGNGDYQHLPKLANPDHDARDIEKLLNELGFDTVMTSDRDARRLSRDLATFVDDAAGADVALLYYAGHGIEAGGENFLVPVDADVSALDAAADRLVPLSPFIERLKATVPLAIVMLDACRDNPFPLGALVRLGPAAEAVPIAAAGLGGSRGAAPLATTATAGQTFGTVLAFSAEPGRAALDGAADTASPYAAAVLRHFGAMNGAEFGTVMRMVGAEVYLKTGGRQRPWVNESLSRLLYFGKAPASAVGEEGEILTERRALLLTIAALPDVDRQQVERVAVDGGVPMDALYAMLQALGQDAPNDPAELDRLLRAQTERLKQLIAERAALKSTDAEIVRLSALADKAIDEGALNTALRLLERAKTRVGELDKTVDEAEADIRARRIEFAEVFARSAETYSLAFDHLKAAEDYEQAFEQVEKWDDQLAWEYRDNELRSLIEQDAVRRDNAALEKAVSLGQETLRLTSPSRYDWAATQNNLANAFLALGQREAGTARLEEAVAAYRAALEEYAIERAALDEAITADKRSVAQKDPEHDAGEARVQDGLAAVKLEFHERRRDQVALDWAMSGNNLGYALRVLGERVSGTAWLEEAVVAHRTVLEQQQRDRAPLDWAFTQNSLGDALFSLGKREAGKTRLEEAAAAYRSALEEYTRDRAPLDWALTTSNLGNVLQTLGEREGGKAWLEEAAAAYGDALKEQSRDRVPLVWARTQASLADVLLKLGEGEGESGTALLEQAIAAYRSALEEYTRDRVPLDWASTQNNLGYALRELGEREGSTARLEEAVAVLRAALEERARDRLPLDWAMTQNNLGNALQTLGKREGGTVLLEQAVSAYRAALEEYTRERMPLQWAKTQNNLGGTLVELGRQSKVRIRVDEGRSAIKSAWEIYQQAGYAQYDGYFARRIAEADSVQAEIGK